jgi:hypothetical protein
MFGIFVKFLKGRNQRRRKPEAAYGGYGHARKVLANLLAGRASALFFGAAEIFLALVIVHFVMYEIKIFGHASSAA